MFLSLSYNSELPRDLACTRCCNFYGQSAKTCQGCQNPGCQDSRGIDVISKAKNIRLLHNCPLSLQPQAPFNQFPQCLYSDVYHALCGQSPKFSDPCRLLSPEPTQIPTRMRMPQNGKNHRNPNLMGHT